jgi:hypothetical protein
LLDFSGWASPASQVAREPAVGSPHLLAKIRIEVRLGIIASFRQDDSRYSVRGRPA